MSRLPELVDRVRVAPWTRPLDQLIQVPVKGGVSHLLPLHLDDLCLACIDVGSRNRLTHLSSN